MRRPTRAELEDRNILLSEELEEAEVNKIRAAAIASTRNKYTSPPLSESPPQPQTQIPSQSQSQSPPPNLHTSTNTNNSVPLSFHSTSSIPPIASKLGGGGGVGGTGTAVGRNHTPSAATTLPPPVPARSRTDLTSDASPMASSLTANTNINAHNNINNNSDLSGNSIQQRPAHAQRFMSETKLPRYTNSFSGGATSSPTYNAPMTMATTTATAKGTPTTTAMASATSLVSRTSLKLPSGSPSPVLGNGMPGKRTPPVPPARVYPTTHNNNNNANNNTTSTMGPRKDTQNTTTK